MGAVGPDGPGYPTHGRRAPGPAPPQPRPGAVARGLEPIGDRRPLDPGPGHAPPAGPLVAEGPAIETRPAGPRGRPRRDPRTRPLAEGPADRLGRGRPLADRRDSWPRLGPEDGGGTRG